MLPYRPSLVREKPPRPKKLKPMPSLELIRSISLLCEGSENTYDSKNHVLTINDGAKFDQAVNQLFHRTFRSFERQLKLLGFRVRRYRRTEEQNDTDANQIKVFKWKGKKQLLIDQELNLIELGLKDRRAEIQKVREEVRRNKKLIDAEIESIILSMIVDFGSQQARESLHKVLVHTKTAVNSSELSIRRIINKMSATMGNELELYKLLIYKQGVTEKRMQEKEEGEDNEENGVSEPNHVIEEENSGNSLVSIEMDANTKRQIKEEQAANDPPQLKESE